MTEHEWLSSTDPAKMLQHLRMMDHGPGLPTERKLRLFACECMNLTTGANTQATEVDYKIAETGRHGGFIPNAAIEQATAWCVNHPEPPTLAQKSALLRDIFGNPWRPLLVSIAVKETVHMTPIHKWLTWSGGAVVQIAQQIYDERDWAAMPILADALMDAGCTDQTILDHCRLPGPHVRGCWVLDCLLGKE